MYASRQTLAVILFFVFSLSLTSRSSSSSSPTFQHGIRARLKKRSIYPVERNLPCRRLSALSYLPYRAAHGPANISRRPDLPPLFRAARTSPWLFRLAAALRRPDVAVPRRPDLPPLFRAARMSPWLFRVTLLCRGCSAPPDVALVIPRRPALPRLFRAPGRRPGYFAPPKRYSAPPRRCLAPRRCYLPYHACLQPVRRHNSSLPRRFSSRYIRAGYTLRRLHICAGSAANTSAPSVPLHSIWLTLLPHRHPRMLLSPLSLQSCPGNPGNTRL